MTASAVSLALGLFGLICLKLLELLLELLDLLEIGGSDALFLFVGQVAIHDLLHPLFQFLDALLDVFYLLGSAVGER